MSFASMFLAISIFMQIAAAPSPVEVHIAWSIWHEGCQVYDNRDGTPPISDSMAPIPVLRGCFLEAQLHNPEAYALIRDLPDAQLLGVVKDAVATIPNEYHLVANLEWVAIHEGQVGALRRLDAAGQYQAIRYIYKDLQSHNPNARNLLAAVSNSGLHDSIASLESTHPNYGKIGNALTPHPDDRVLVINPTDLTQDAANAIQAELLRLVPQERWASIKVSSDQKVESLMQALYGAKNEKAASELGIGVSAANNLDGSIKIKAGQTIAVPPVPSLGVPKGGGATDLQTLDLDSLSLLHHGNEVAVPTQSSSKNKVPATSWIFTGPPQVITQFVASLPAEVQPQLSRSSYQGPTFETGRLVLMQDGSTGGAAAGGAVSPLPLPHLNLGSSFSTNQKYYVLDFFDNYGLPHGQCAHGQKVLDVIRETLASQGGSQLFTTNVVPVELDYFRHQSTQDHYLADYITRQAKPIQPFLSSVVKDLKQRDLTQVSAYETPLLYLQAVYDSILLDPNASVISSSFYTESAGFGLLPAGFNSTSRPVTVSAVDDNTGFIETFTLEPIRTLYERRHDDPVLLVGGMVNGSPFGMTSQIGDGVSTLGQVDGWGDGTSCIQQSDRGTSFATPQVATVTFLTRAFWLSNGLDISGNSLQNRMLHSAPITWSDPARYSTPGTPNTAWATKGRIGLFVDAAGNPLAVQSASGSVSFSYPGSAGVFQDPVQAGPRGVSGIQRSGADLLVFENAEQRWLKVNLIAISLHIVATPSTAGAGTTDLTIATIAEVQTKLGALAIF